MLENYGHENIPPNMQTSIGSGVPDVRADRQVAAPKYIVRTICSN